MREVRVARTSTLLGLAAAALASTAASPSPVAEAFGATIVSTYPDGRTAELWLAADGSYTGEGRRHDPSSGHWTVKGAKLCLKQSRPIPAFFTWCTPIPAGGFSADWAAKAPTGEATRVKLVPGHVAGG
jgi:hypothetical protein